MRASEERTPRTPETSVSTGTERGDLLLPETSPLLPENPIPLRTPGGCSLRTATKQPGTTSYLALNWRTHA